MRIEEVDQSTLDMGVERFEQTAVNVLRQMGCRTIRDVLTKYSAANFYDTFTSKVKGCNGHVVHVGVTRTLDRLHSGLQPGIFNL